jgi:hypothetical protein
VVEKSKKQQKTNIKKMKIKSNIRGSRRKEALKLPLLLLALCSLLLAPGFRAFAQIGAYVTTRPTPLFLGSLTNNQSLTNVFVGTNFLNYSGFHRPGLWATITTTNLGTALNGNVTLSVDFSPGSGAGYTNSLLGTNLIYTTGAPFAWTIPLTGTNPIVTFTNLDWPWSDSTVLFKGTKLSTTYSNAPNFQIELDAVVTP